MKHGGFPLHWLLATAGVVAVAAATFSARAGALSQREKWPSEVDELYLPPVAVISRASLGHTEFMSDLVSARLNVYFGDQISTRGRQRWLHYYVNAATDLDPYFEALYLRGATMMVYKGEAFTLEMFKEAEKILEKGTRFFPNNWNLWFQLGFNRAFEMTQLVPKDSESFHAFQREGTEALRRATLFEGVPSHIAMLVSTMLTKSGKRDLAIEHLKRTYAISSDPKAREQIGSRLKSLLGEQYRDTYADEAAQLQTTVVERFPYAPEGFSIILGQRGVSPFKLTGDANTAAQKDRP
jgi:tetratricopeptide (TPR) repeat protein